MNMKLIREYETRAAAGSSAGAESSAQKWLLAQESQQSKPLALTSARPMSDLQDARPKLAFTRSTPPPESRGLRLATIAERLNAQPVPTRVEIDEWDIAPSFAEELNADYMYVREDEQVGGGVMREYPIGNQNYRVYLNSFGDIIRGVEVIYEET